jgi:HEAT repeat protein
MNSPDEMAGLGKSYPGGSMEMELIETLADIGCDADELTRLVKPYVSDQRGGGWARAILSRSAPDEARQQVALLIPLLEGEQTSIVESALGTLWGYRTQAQAAVPALLKLATTTDKKIAWSATRLLIAISPAEAAPLVPALLSQLERDPLKPSEPWQPFVESLAAIGPAASPAIPALQRILESSPPTLTRPKENRHLEWLRLKVILALGRIGVDDSNVIEQLCRLLNGESWRDRAAAAEALSSPGMPAETVLRDLITALRDEDDYVRGNAALAIGELSGDRTAAVKPLTAALDDFNAYVQTAATIALGQIGEPAGPAVESLREAARQPENAFSNYRRSDSLPWGLRDDRFHHRRSFASAARWALSQIETAEAKEHAE